MKPNMFFMYRHFPEGYFSSSLAFVLNLFPTICQRLIQRIAVVAGKNLNHFGDFEHCEFVGLGYPLPLAFYQPGDVHWQGRHQRNHI